MGALFTRPPRGSRSRVVWIERVLSEREKDVHSGYMSRSDACTGLPRGRSLSSSSSSSSS